MKRLFESDSEWCKMPIFTHTTSWTWSAKLFGLGRNVIHTMSRILIVGSGLTGSAVKFFLSGSLPAFSGSTISLWEASHTVGGRMQTDKLFGNHRCDLGAQYISQNVNGMLEGLGVYDYLINHGALDQIGDNRIVDGMRPEHLLGQHYIAKTGTASMMASLTDDCGTEFGKEVTGLEVETGAEKLVVMSKDAAPEAFDVVVLTVPAPQLVQILQHTKTDGTVLVSHAIIENLQQVRYSSRFALAVYYEFPSADAKHNVLDSVPWRAKYVMDDDVVRYVSIENFKYEAGTKEEEVVDGSDERHILSVLVHTSVPYGLAHPEVLSLCSPQLLKDVHRESVSDLEQRKQDVIDSILQHLVTPGALPALSGHTPLRARLVGWEQSQVSRGYYAVAGASTASSVSAGGGAVGSGTGVSAGADNSRGVLDAVDATAAQPPVIVLCTALPPANKVCGKDDAEEQEKRGKILLTAVQDPILVPEEGSMNCSPLNGAAPLLVLAGDAFTESNFDGCVKSARHAAQAILKHLNARQG